ncbi:hypothetical protein [Emticicia sp. BO119]|uniref:hypothetical protein n=1 Tax=Emticicia sp. BO119 TaxID=2757768 RepID=UPI0015EFE27B|nr:hypothetical protein [Emticicia sp. BO119]MBA4850020.1 hypothetical protein [Emticicia sp. BO119]
MESLKINSFSRIFFRLVLISALLKVLFAIQEASAQSITISPSNASSIQTSRSINNIDLIKTGTNNTSGFRFYQNASLRGGLFYNDTDNTLNFTHNPNIPGIVWNTDSQRAGIGVKLPEGRLHILTNSTDTVPHILIQENNDGDGGRLNFENFGVADKHWTLYGRNSNAATLSSNVLNIYHSSFGNVAQFTGDGNTQLNGYTQLGSNAPKIKVIKLTGTLDDDNFTSGSLSIPIEKILSFTAQVKYSEVLYQPSSTVNSYSYEFRLSSQNSPYNFFIFDGVPSDLRGQPYTIFITYEE